KLKEGKIPIAYEISSLLDLYNPNVTVVAANGYIRFDVNGNFAGIRNHRGNGGFIRIKHGKLIGEIIQIRP
ncbi:MAG: hypothetical protein JXR68_08775, partial [Bacteroidales bacterium]|nr:hypothetical protein [Bacteroidales bacterium]